MRRSNAGYSHAAAARRPAAGTLDCIAFAMDAEAENLAHSPYKRTIWVSRPIL